MDACTINEFLFCQFKFIRIFSLKDLYLALREKRSNLLLVLAVIGAALGLLILFDPFGSFRTFAIFAGAALVYAGITSLINELKA